jgi:hypothetical protein
MNCAWCGANDDGSDSHGICENCMISHFGVNPEGIHEEIIEEEEDYEYDC